MNDVLENVDFLSIDVYNFHAEQTRGSTSKTLQILPKPGNPDFEAITADLIPFVLSQKVGTTALTLQSSKTNTPVCATEGV